MMTRVFLVILFLAVPILAKECYHTKKERVCFRAFFDINKLKDPKRDEEYYRFKDGYVYTFKDQIKLTLNYTGAILYILDNYPVEFADKRDHDTFILKVKDHTELLSIVTNLNRLNGVKLAEPFIERKEYKLLVRKNK